ncbi:MFS transporter [Pantoea dispersa]|uniref:Major facilitator transporter n=1 Tax=Pantoea dispersa TaxID=59814 RepID=A0A8E1RTT9_9GAMM|nr:MFS transporter [Pantoea dispersa]KTR87858.1 major facilitator transporter [Pantoea dispersa]KTR98677.1 major facilitator transporter [Pantoea dispersa]KTS20777.1 major facilitator transporter [Pantoea dispersa]KTS32295.1 major facilitator transporter [Pantoea dispersa]KTS51437.1 major facilitator transporter [Pantoea dispersa]
MRQLFRFMYQHGSHLAFGTMLMAMSSFGQTYFVSLYGQDLRQAFGLSNGGLGGLYAAGTVMSAVTLTWAGRMIDYTTTRRFTLAVTLLLITACLLVSGAQAAWMLCAGFYLLRLGGQGLMVHTALTATARQFPLDAGKALGAIALGLSLAQALFPLAAVQIIYLTGWRTAWLINAAVLVAGVALAVSCLPRAAEKPLRTFRKRGAEKVREASIWKNRNLLLALPAVLASPFITTGFFFHQARLAEENGWALSWVAGWFIAYAITQAVSLLSFGPLIDRLTPRRLLPWFLLPQGAGLLALWLSSSQWVTPFYLIMIGVSSAIASTLATALWVQLFGSAQLAKVRSAVEAGTVLASGASPVIMGVLIDHHVTLRIQALICLVFIIAASLVAIQVQVASPEDINS